MDERELLTLWREGLRMARQACGHTLARLENGDGGFYEAEDLLQDLFLEFWRVAEAWQASDPANEEALWAAWRRRLWRGGARILRRAPQRLWRRAEVRFAPDELDAAGDAELGAARMMRSIERALVQADEAPAACEQREALGDVTRALERMPAPVARSLTMTVLESRPASEVAEALGLPDARSVYAHVRQARAGLGRLRR
ncbi:MAG: sigma-70 family RNA polymerase sigma factor [Chloroflexi bacterium]|nr:sigma-70 family RNA polymerase sigma factor [Chloroflexota bacterium]